MAEAVTNQPSNEPPAPAASDPAAAKPMQGHEYQPDPELDDRSHELLDVFGPEADWSEIKAGLESKLQARGGGGGQASDAPDASAAEGEPEGLTPAPATPKPPAAGASPMPQPKPGAQAPALAAPAPAAEPQPNAEVQALKAQVEALLGQMAKLQGQPGAQPPAQPSGSPAPAEGPAWAKDAKELMEYRYAIPADVMQAIDSEDPNQRSLGLHHLVNSFAQITHQKVMEHVDRHLSSRLSDFGSTLQVSQQHQEMNRQYYSAFPDHQTPGNMMVVAQEAQAMWQENPTLAWTADTLNALGARVNAKLGIVALQPAAEPTPTPAAPAAKPAKRPAAMTEATTRQGQGNGKNDSGQGIRDILTSFN